MKAQKLIASAFALSIVLTCISVFSQDAPLPAPATATQSPAKNPRAGYTPLADGSRQTSADKGGTMAAIDNTTPSAATAYKTFTSGSGDTLFKFTISSHGNIIRLESPADFEHLANGSVGEG